MSDSGFMWTQEQAEAWTAEQIAGLTRERDEARDERDALSVAVDLMGCIAREMYFDWEKRGHMLKASHRLIERKKEREREAIRAKEACEQAKEAAEADNAALWHWAQIANEALNVTLLLLQDHECIEEAAWQDHEDVARALEQPHPGASLLAERERDKARLVAAEGVCSAFTERHAEKGCMQAISPECLCSCGLEERRFAALSAWEEARNSDVVGIEAQP